LVKCPKCGHEFEPEEAPVEEAPAEVEKEPAAAEETA